MAGGRRGRGRGRGRGIGNPNESHESTNRRRRRSSGPSMFIDGGLLSDWSSTPNSSRGKNPGVNSNNKSGSKSGSFDRTKSSSNPKIGPQKSGGNNYGYGYQYPSFDFQESRLESNTEVKSLNDSYTIPLVNSKEVEIFAYVDKTPSSRSPDEGFIYSYTSDFALGESSHRGLGFSEELEETPSGVESSSKQMEVEEDPFLNSLSSEQELNAKNKNSCDLGTVTAEELPAVTSSSRRNSGFLSFGGMKLYTEDMSDEEDEDDDDGEVMEVIGSSESSDLGSSESDDDSEDTSDSGSDVDDEVAEDYLEGIGGRESILNSKWLVDQELGDSDDGSSSSGGFNKTVKKLGGIALQEASREYGMQNSNPRKKGNGGARESWSPVIDDLMFIKDKRKISGKKKQVATGFPQSWPSGAHKSKNFRNFPGEKKKHRKETIAVKRRERMLNRGVDLEKINFKLEQIVLDGVDMHSFQPMHSRDCSQVRRLASIYRLWNGVQGSGKKGFVTVARTQHTCMPSSNDRVRLEKLIGAEDADFSLVECSNSKSLSGDRKRSNKIWKSVAISPLEPGKSVQRKSSANRRGKSNENRNNGKRDSFANQPVSFVSSGILGSDGIEIVTEDLMETDSSRKDKGVAESANFGAFEVHTKGFGSKMMAKMGFVEGGGLGKDGKGIAEPIEVIKRPKSLGLGVEFVNTVDDPSSSDPPRSRAVKNKSRSQSQSQSLGSFEKHTKGFGSKIMAKMGFVEGMGLGRDSQGITNPLVATRLPKSRGLGAKH